MSSNLTFVTVQLIFNPSLVTCCSDYAPVRCRHKIHLVRVRKTQLFVATNTAGSRPEVSLKISSGVTQMLKRRRKQRSLAWQPRRYDSTMIPFYILDIKDRSQTCNAKVIWRTLCHISSWRSRLEDFLLFTVSVQTSSSSQRRESPSNSTDWKKKKGPAWIKSWDTAPKKCMVFFRFPPFDLTIMAHQNISFQLCAFARLIV